jgi:nitrous oxide reductase accessory protein NosL
MCAHTHEIIDAEKRPADLQYDRCSPSLIAFARRDEAAAFARRNGGEVLPFREVAAAFTK